MRNNASTCLVVQHTENVKAGELWEGRTPLFLDISTACFRVEGVELAVNYSRDAEIEDSYTGESL